MPACRAALYTLKPTFGIVPANGVMALTYHSDSVGPMAKSAEDIANMMDVMVDHTKTKVPQGGYSSRLNRQWKNIRVGAVKPQDWLLGAPIVVPVEPIDKQMVNYPKLHCRQKEADILQMDGFLRAYSVLEKHAARFKHVQLISTSEATANGTKDIRNLASKIVLPTHCYFC